jgi:endonuclease G
MLNMLFHNKRIFSAAKHSFLLFACSFLVVFSHAQTSSKRAFEWPAYQQFEQLISHLGYVLRYEERFQQASWVAYELTAQETAGTFGRTNKFRPDPLVKTGSANDADYKGSGYDRGHLAPAADMGWSAQSMMESFYYTNMSPQVPSFNRGIWKKLEEFTRAAAVVNHQIYVVTGPVLKSDLSTIGPNEVAVPLYFYKVLLDYSQPEIKGIAFIMPNSASANPIEQYATTIDYVEELTHLNFFPSLSQEEEALLESKYNFSLWNTASGFRNASNTKTSVSAASQQCNGVTQKGTRCSRTTKNSNGYCYQHQP